VKDLRDAINQDNIQRVKLLFDQLQKESMRVGQSVYQKTQAKTGQGPENGGEVNDGGAEYIPPEDNQ